MSMIISSFREPQREDLIQLWRRCDLVVPGNDPDRDIDLKLAEQPELLLIGETRQRLVASVMSGYDGHRGWLNYLAVDPDFRRLGYGRAMLAHAEELLFSRGCPKINLQIRSSNSNARSFYESLGYRVEDRLSFGKRRSS